MKLNMKKKGFTIVELVIVIAVIAVLAAVLIPTFINLTSKANKAADDSLVTSLNKALAIEEVDHDVDNMHDAVECLKREGYIASALVTKSDQKLLYSLDDNRFLLEEDKKSDVPDYKYWTIQDSYDATKQQYSIYAADNFSTAEISGLKVGFDAGDSNVVSNITYVGNGSNEQNVVIRTNDANSKLTVDAPVDEVSHYSVVSSVDILAVKGSSYHEYGRVLGNITITKGNLSMEQKSSAAAIVVDLSVVSSDSTASLSVDTSGNNTIPVIVNKTSADSLSNVTLNIVTEEVVNTSVTGVAVIKNTGYETLAAAIDAATANDVIVLLNDINYSSSESLLINKTINLNLNGKNISGSKDPLFAIGSDIANYKPSSDHYTHAGYLKISGEGTVTSTNYDLFAIFPDAKLEINSGNYVARYQTLLLNGGAAYINGGNFSTTGTGASQIIYGQNDASLNIYSGTFTSNGDNGTYGVLLETGAEINCGSRGEAGPTFNTWRPCLATNGSTSHAVVMNIYSGTYKAYRTTSTPDDQSVFQIANNTTQTQTINVYGGYFEQVAAEHGAVFHVRYDGTINFNISGGTFKCIDSSRFFSGYSSSAATMPSNNNVRVNVTNNAITTRQVVETYLGASRNPNTDFVVVQ